MDKATSTPTEFDYLLNAFEMASQHTHPSTQGYLEKRRAVLAYVSSLSDKVERMEQALIEIANLRNGLGPSPASAMQALAVAALVDPPEDTRAQEKHD